MVTYSSQIMIPLGDMILNMLGSFILFFGVLFANFSEAQPCPPKGKKWKKVVSLSDEFDKWDRNKWTKPLWNYGEPVQMQAQNSGVKDGKLWIKATLGKTRGEKRWFKTSRVQSRAKISYPMYTECAMKAAHISAYNTFWMNNGNIKNRDEIDIAENNSNPSDTSEKDNWPTALNSQYFLTVNGEDERQHGDFDSSDLSEGNLLRGVPWNESYHIIGVWWIDNQNIQFYLNGEKAGRVTSARKFTRKLNIIWDLWTVDEPWLGGIARKKDLKNEAINTMLVDWIHTYKLVDDPTNQKLCEM